MSPVNQNFYDLNAGRCYPLDDSATGLDDLGQFLSGDLLVDCCLRFASDLGTACYVAAVTVAAKLVTVLISSDAEEYLPLAAVTLTQPVTPGRAYAVTPLQPSVGGWLVFGAGINTPQTYRFSSSDQSRILSRCARAVAPPPVTSLSKLGRLNKLNGIVKLLAGNDITITHEDVVIGQAVRPAFVLRLTADTTTRNTLQTYAGPCGVRPESDTCLRPGIQFINSVSPDCTGNINIDFSGLIIHKFEDESGIVLDHKQSMLAACQQAIDNRQPTKIDLCPAESSLDEGSMSIIHVSLPGDDPEDFPTPQVLPVSYDFAIASPDSFLVTAGEFQRFGGAYQSTAPAVRNVTLFSHSGALNGTRVVTQFSCRDSDANKNAGIVLNRRVEHNADGLEIESYLLVLVDMLSNQLKLLRFNGIGFVSEYISTLLPLRTDDRYQLTATINSMDATRGVVQVELRGLSVGDFPTVTFSVSTTQLSDANLTGHNGLGANYANSLFYTFAMDRP